MNHNILFCMVVSLVMLGCQNNGQVRVEKITDETAELGEGAIWNAKSGHLLWVDIMGHKLFSYDPESGENTVFELPEAIGTVVPVDKETVLIALRDGIYHYNLADNKMLKVANPEPDSVKVTARFNDGKCDPAGRFWVGSMHDPGQKRASASLYRIDRDYSVHTMLNGISISNGIAWSPDKTRMYYIDTPTRKVAAFDFDNETGAISNKTYTVSIPDSLGFPDGSTIDAEGMLWIAMWNGHAVTRWNPETGELLGKIDIPAQNITSVAFGGSRLDVLYVTSAYSGMNEEQKKAYPLSGSLFKLNPGVKGIDPNYFKPEK